MRTEMQRMSLQVFVLTVTLLGASLSSALAEDVFWLGKPATDWQKEALPLGNGRMGCMVFGGVEAERIHEKEEREREASILKELENL